MVSTVKPLPKRASRFNGCTPECPNRLNEQQWYFQCSVGLTCKQENTAGGSVEINYFCMGDARPARGLALRRAVSVLDKSKLKKDPQNDGHPIQCYSNGIHSNPFGMLLEWIPFSESIRRRNPPRNPQSKGVNRNFASGFPVEHI